MNTLSFSTIDDFVEHAFDAGWTDGLPVFAPDAQAVAGALATVHVPPETLLGTGQGGTLSVKDVAVAAVLAGCESSYFPLVLAASQAALEGLGDGGVGVPTLPDASQCVIVNGPVRNRINVNCGLGLYGPGWRANATIGRAVRFVARSVVDFGSPSFGDPGQYTLCFGEDEENSRWTPLHVQRGLEPHVSAATVLSTVVRSLCHDRHSRTPEGLLDSVVRYGRGRMSGSDWFGDDACSLLLIFPPETKVVLGSWSKEAVHDYLYPRLVADDDTPIQPVRLRSPEDLLIVAAGGAAFSGVQLMLAHSCTAVTRQVRDDKELIR